MVWTGAIGFGIFAFIWIVMVMAGVFRKKQAPWSKDAVIGCLIHGATAVTALWMFMNAAGQISEVDGVSGDRMEDNRTEKHPKY